MSLALDGVRVLELARFQAGPRGGMILSDLGAEVIKIERPQGGDLCRQLYVADQALDGDSALFHTINRNKRSLTADLKNPDYRASLVANEGVRVISYVNAAIVIGTYHSKGTYKRQPFEHYGRFTDTWLYQNNKWQCVASHTNLIKQ